MIFEDPSFEDIGETLLRVVSRILEFIAPLVAGDVFPGYFEVEIFQRALIGASLVP